MRFLSLAGLSAGLGLALLAAPLAMAQTYSDQHANGMPHMADHQMPAPSHRTASLMHEKMDAKPRAQPREVSNRHHTVQTSRHAAMAPHHAPMAPHSGMPHQG
jgi:hypothetical protein